MNLRRLGFAVLVLGSSSILWMPSTSAAPAASYWFEATPQNSAEAELRDALARAQFADPMVGAASLRQVSDAHPGTAVSGLAQLGAGLLIVERGRATDARLFLRHPDIEKTSLADYAQLALAQSLDASRDPAAAQAYLAAANARPEGPLACAALFHAADAMEGSARTGEAIVVLTRAMTTCPRDQARALLEIADLRRSQHELKAAAEALDRLDREFPASSEAKEAAASLRALASYVPSASADARNARDLRKALALSDAGDNTRAVPLLRALLTRKLGREDADLVHLRLGRVLLSTNHEREGEAQLAAVSDDSPWGAEAAFQRAKLTVRRTQRADAYETVATRYKGTPWGEEALLSLANFYQKDARDDDALPYYRRLVEGYPEGRYAERAAWRVAWGDYRQGRFDEAAQSLERTARLMPTSPYTPGMLYWAGRARLNLGDTERARQLLAETVQRYKYSYHGLRAQEALARLPAVAAAPALVLRAPSAAPNDGIPEAQLTRLRQLLLLDRIDFAYDELKALPPTSATQATIAWLESRRGRLRPAITAMKRAYPEYVSQAGDELPEPVWRIIYPLAFGDILTTKAAEEALDPALVAALICQESTFDADAVSRAGARGLMQVMPKTGRTIARAKRVSYSTRALHDPTVAMDFGTHYLRRLMDRFDGRVERVLAAYNAGPERVDAWTAGQPDMSAEEFVERIPFTETRIYVMTVLASREQYRRLYALAQPAQAATAAGDARP